ncbi:phosphatidylglycerophosphatase A family protein [Marinicellulosiphila megalodicopiae]|uniref:phosphatidylglycerophosphatase A family protein n=1 Tax=Marinicellulosiphila megalodicopiae TaxID=2724896 RepID=UPI003BAF2427
MIAENPHRNWKNHWVHFLAFGLGSGAAKKAPGTFGTLAAIPFFIALSFLHLYAFIAIVTLSFIVGVYFCDRASKDMGVHDHGGIVWDEFVGFWITMAPLIYLADTTTFSVAQYALYTFLGFVFFRFFDILKPWPIKWLDQKVHGGFGIMIDDVLAGFFALTFTHVSIIILTPLLN